MSPLISTSIFFPCRYNLAYVHFVEPRIAGNVENDQTPYTLAPFRAVRASGGLQDASQAVYVACYGGGIEK